MGIIIGNTASTSSTSNASSYSLSLDNNKDYVAFFVMAMATAETARTLTATYNSVDMAELVTIQTTTPSRRYVASIFGLDNGSAGANNCTANFNANMSSIVLAGMCFEFQAIAPAGDTDTNNAGCLSSIVTTQADSLILSCSAVRSNTTPPTLTPEADQTEIVNTTPLNGSTDVVGGAWYRLVTAINTYSVGATASDTTGDIGVAVEIKALASLFLHSPIDFR